MNLCDSNVWVALAISGHPFHAAALRWFESVQEAGAVLFCQATQQSFLRLLTSTAVLALYGNAPLSNREAWRLYEALLADDRIVYQRREPQGLERYWQQWARRDTASPKLWMDAYLAAFARAEGCRLITIDRAFMQFDGLDLVLLTNSKVDPADS